MAAPQLPSQLAPGMASFNQGFKSVGDLMNQLRDHALKQQQLQELMKYHGVDIGLRRGAAARAEEMRPLNTDLIRARIEHLKNGNNGISISTDPDTGQPLIQIGGSKSNSQGGTFINPATGETVSRPTGASTTKLQNRIAGEEQLKPIIDQIIETVPQFQSGWKRGETALEGIANKWLGTNFEGPSVKQSGHAALSKSAESLVNLFGLHANARNVEEVKNILEPAAGESAEGYKKRIQKELLNFAKSSATAKSQLRKGIDVSKEGATSLPDEKEIQAEAEYFNTTPDIIISAIKAGVKTEDEFRDWVKGMK